MTIELREKIARAHFDAWRANNPGTLIWEKFGETHKQRFYDTADVSITALSTPPDEDRTTSELEAAVAELQRDVERGEYSGGGYRYIEADPEALRKVLAHLSSPPADDVREALIEVLADEQNWIDQGSHFIFNKGYGADAILSRFEVRLRGTVADTEAPDVAEAYVCRRHDPCRLGFGHSVACVESNAARGARVSAENITPTNHENRSTE